MGHLHRHSGSSCIRSNPAGCSEHCGQSGNGLLDDHGFRDIDFSLYCSGQCDGNEDGLARLNCDEGASSSHDLIQQFVHTQLTQLASLHPGTFHRR